MDMKFSGSIELSGHDGYGYVMEAYLPEKDVYVCVEHCYDDWSYSVNEKPRDVYPNVMTEVWGDEDYKESEYAEVYEMLRGMICVMELAND